jgi:hypothetical protein
MNYERLQKAGHDICKVGFLDDEQFLEHARSQARSKAPYTHPSDPSGDKRSERAIFNMQFLGTIADIACSNLLEQYLDKYAPDLFEVERYDDIRVDNYQRPDKFDTRITSLGGQTLVEIEIRSSVCNKIPVAAMVKSWHVLGWYVTQNKPTEKIRDLYMRPLYHYNLYETGPAYEASNAEEYLMDGLLDLYIVGGATPEILRERGEIQKDYGLLQEETTYQVVGIRKSMGTGDFLKTALELCQSRSTQEYS